MRRSLLFALVILMAVLIPGGASAVGPGGRQWVTSRQYISIPQGGPRRPPVRLYRMVIREYHAQRYCAETRGRAIRGRKPVLYCYRHSYRWKLVWVSYGVWRRY